MCSWNQGLQAGAVLPVWQNGLSEQTPYMGAFLWMYVKDMYMFLSVYDLLWDVFNIIGLPEVLIKSSLTPWQTI